MRVLWGLGFVILRPIVIPLGYIGRFVRNQYNDGVRTYDIMKRLKKIKTRA